MIQNLCLFILVALSSACASVPMMDLGADQEAKQFNTPAGRSRIYIFRNESFGGAIKVAMSVDGKSIGQTAPHTYFVLDVKPGKHEIACLAESNSDLTVTTQRGKSSYVWQEMKMGLIQASRKLSEVTQEEGQKAVASCKRAQVKNF